MDNHYQSTPTIDYPRQSSKQFAVSSLGSVIPRDIDQSRAQSNYSASPALLAYQLHPTQMQPGYFQFSPIGPGQSRQSMESPISPRYDPLSPQALNSSTHYALSGEFVNLPAHDTTGMVRGGSTSIE
ncbi:hypothetical protein P280DRAFT_518456 [Massarina eburnea CBS 473.64]|uniref:Uncharacterized protein n=1 Tax=Massarina eburnea CBS 473.64 TaxID=1395130 RepID=A0A6A6RWU7_9PLEO|nr:hypothetical protein P280DRAFT_518456 [Massarina eburnea CBS 473.64]